MDQEFLEGLCMTDKQLDRVRRYFRLNCNFAATAREEGVDESSVRNCIKRLETKAAKAGYSPHEDANGLIPDGYKLKGKSIYRKIAVGKDDEGKTIYRNEWVKSEIDKSRQEEISLEILEAFKDDIPKHEPVEQIEFGSDELLNMFIITDYHLGMKAWGEETRAEDWDIKIAEDLLVKWFQVTIDKAPAAKTAFFAQLGDFLHWDSLESPVTPMSGHVLDADTRFQKMVRVALRVILRIINMLLEKHETVYVLHAEGNHDLASSVWLKEIFKMHYSDNPRVIVDDSPDPYYAYHHGKTALFFHHGHRKNFAQLPAVFVRKFRDLYGKVNHAYAHTGHFHHDKKLEDNLLVIEQHRTLAAADAYASKHGYMSNRDSKLITYHKEYGEVLRTTVNPDMVYDEIVHTK